MLAQFGYNCNVKYLTGEFSFIIWYVHHIFRVIKLQNGLTALLISDVKPDVCSSQDDDEDKGKCG